MLRLLVPDRAVQMDPILWHAKDANEDVALHLISGIASVPMISVELDEYPRTHLDLIRFWIGFYNSHRQTIIHGGFRPRFHPTHIPLIDFVGEDEVITGLYDTARVTMFDEAPAQWVLNASPESFGEFENESSRPRHVGGRDKYSGVVYERSCDPVPTRLEIGIGRSVEICREVTSEDRE